MALLDRCPDCGAGVRADAPWCTQCYRALGAPAAPVPAPVPEPEVARPAPVVPLPRAEAAPVGWPCACGALVPMGEPVCTLCGSAFLAAARDERPRLVLPVLGDVAGLRRGQRVLLAAAVVLGAGAVTAVASALG